MRSSKPSVPELRAVAQPDAVIGRANSEHWAGRLYMRHLSVYLTRLLIPTPVTPNAVTWLMISSGLLAAAVLAVPGLWPALAALVLIQLQLLFDCSDGELARWRRTTSPVGVYLDRIGHYSTEAAMAAAVGVRADGGYGSIGGWTTLGLLVAVLVLMQKAETDLVHVARAFAGLPKMAEAEQARAPRTGLLRAARRAAGRLPFYRALNAIELTFLALAAAVADAVAASLAGSRVLLLSLLGVAVVVVAGHLASVLASDRLR